MAARGRAELAAERSQTLPRGFGRSRSAATGLPSTTGPPPPPVSADSATLPRGRHTSTTGELKRQSALGLSASGGLGTDVDARPAKRATSTVSMTSIGYRGELTVAIHHTTIVV